MVRWLLPALLLAVAVLLGTGSGQPLALLWLEHVWPQLFRLAQSLQLLSPVPLALVFVPLLLLLFVWVLWRRRARALFGLALLLSVLALWVQLGWGVNYQREPAPQQLGFAAASSLEQRLQLGEYLLQVIVDTAEAEADVQAGLDSGREALGLLLEDLGYPGPLQADVHQLPAGSLLAFDVLGSLFPFTLEAFMDGGLTDWQLVSIGVHELSHVAGVAREDDATLLAAIAGLQAGHEFTRYATALDAFSRLQLPEEQLAALTARLPQRARADLQAGRNVGVEYRQAWLADAQSAVFSWWLRLQGSEAGLADYSLGASRLPLALEAGLLP